MPAPKDDPTIAELREELRAMRARVAALEDTGSGRHRAEPEDRHSRRWLLTAGAGVAAAGIGAVLATPEQASAAAGGNMIIGAANSAGTAVTSLTSGPAITAGPTFDVASTTTGGNSAIRGTSGASSGLIGSDFTAILGDANTNETAGVAGASSLYYGVWGETAAGAYSGVYGNHTTVGTGVLGQSAAGNGVVGKTAGGGVGVTGISSEPSGGGAGVVGQSIAGIGVSGLSTNSAGLWGQTGPSSGLAQGVPGAVVGDTAGNGIAGVFGASASGPGVSGVTNGGPEPGVVGSNTTWLDIKAAGSGRIQQVLRSTAGAPTGNTVSFVAGEQIRDAAGQAWICTVGGAPGTWQKLAAVAPGANGGSTNMLDTPTRLYDSRSGQPSDITTPKQQLQNGTAGALPLTATGQGGIPAGAIGILGTLTITNTNGAGYLALYPTGGTVPATSNINWTATGQTVAASYTCALSSAGSVTIYNGGGPTDVILDIAGYIY